MRLEFEKFDGRQMTYVPVMDHESGQQVGYISAPGAGMYNRRGINVSLFGDKYKVKVNGYDECIGFVKGVETVLNHVTRHITDTGYPLDKFSR